MLSLRLNSSSALELVFLPWHTFSCPKPAVPLAWTFSNHVCIGCRAGSWPYRLQEALYRRQQEQFRPSGFLLEIPPPHTHTPFFLSSHPKNSEFWHQKRKILRWIQEEICFWKMHALHFRKTNKKFPCHWRLNCSGFTFLLLRLPAKQQPQSPVGRSVSTCGASPACQLGLFDTAMLLNNTYKYLKCSTATSHPQPLLASVLQMFHQL